MCYSCLIENFPSISKTQLLIMTPIPHIRKLEMRVPYEKTRETFPLVFPPVVQIGPLWYGCEKGTSVVFKNRPTPI